jgi:hypothetical protein
VRNKIDYLDAAHVFDTWRVVPRFVLFGYGGWVAHTIDRVLTWYMHLPAAERTLEASGMATAVISVVTGLLPWVYRIYSDTATDWSQAKASSTITQTTSTVGVPPA